MTDAPQEPEPGIWLIDNQVICQREAGDNATYRWRTFEHLGKWTWEGLWKQYATPESMVVALVPKGT